MTRSENIMSRWSRMKQQPAEHAEPDGSPSEAKPIDAEPGDLGGATVATPATELFSLSELRSSKLAAASIDHCRHRHSIVSGIEYPGRTNKSCATSGLGN